MSKSMPIIISMATFLGFIDTFLLLPVIEWYAEELGATLAVAGVIVGIYSIVNTPVNVVFGWVVDRFGRRTLLALGLAWEAVNMFSYSLCRVPWQLFLVRALHGASGGIIGPSTMSLMADISPKMKRGRMMGFYGSSIGLAVLIGFAGSGIIVRLFNVYTLFYIGSILIFMGLLLVLFFILPREISYEDNSNKLKIENVFMKDFLKLIRRRELFASYLAVFSYFFSFGSIIILMPPYLRSFGMGNFEFAMLLTIFSIIVVIFQFPCGNITDKFGRRIPIFIGLGLASTVLILFSIVTSFLLLVLMMAIYGVGFSFLFPSASALIADKTAPECRGMGTGIFHSMLTSGTAAGAPIMGLIGEYAGVEIGLVLTSVATILGLLIAAILLKKVRQ